MPDREVSNYNRIHTFQIGVAANTKMHISGELSPIDCMIRFHARSIASGHSLARHE